MGRSKRVGLIVIALASLAGGTGYRLFVRDGSAAPAAPPMPARTPARTTLAAAASELPAPPREIPIGQPLPPIVLPDDRGERVALSAAAGGAPAVFLFFRAKSCPLCRSQLGAFAAVAARFRAAGVVVVASSPDSPSTLAALRRELGLPMRLLSDADEQAVNALCGGVAHCQILVDARGVVRWGTFSESWGHPPTPMALLDSHLAW